MQHLRDPTTRGGGVHVDHALTAEEVLRRIYRAHEFCGAIVAVLVLLIQVWMLVVGLERPVEFFPAIDPKSVYINVDPPEGADLSSWRYR